MPRLKAKKRIETGDYNPTDFNQIYRLWLLAYEDEEAARKAQAQSVQLLVDKQCGRME